MCCNLPACDSSHPISRWLPLRICLFVCDNLLNSFSTPFYFVPICLFNRCFLLDCCCWLRLNPLCLSFLLACCSYTTIFSIFFISYHRFNAIGFNGAYEWRRSFMRNLFYSIELWRLSLFVLKKENFFLRSKLRAPTNRHITVTSNQAERAFIFSLNCTFAHGSESSSVTGYGEMLVSDVT